MQRYILALLMASMSGAALAESPKMELFDHNGSQMMVEYGYDAIRYAFPKQSLRGTIDRNQVAFTGSIEYRGSAEGTAYVYKRGCPWAEYPVSGHYDPSIPGFVLTGKAPVRKKGGCRVVGYTAKSPNARLVFIDVEEQSKRSNDATANAIYEDESQPGWAEGFLDGDGEVGKVSQ